ncbi:MAG: sugar porter family MFS transporter [Planctomycetes bacterium]|nr:sugar porter family MFS transporter [Planctomycetota bacterium]
MQQPDGRSPSPRRPPAAEGSRGYVYLLTFVAALGGVLFGYDTAVIAGAIDFLGEHFDLTELQEGDAAGGVLIGCMIGAALAGFLSDLWGRKKLLIIAAVLFAVSAVASAFPRSLAEIVLARLLGGLGVGAASIISPLYIAEVSPPRIRGRLVSINQLAIVSGMLVVYYVNAVIESPDDKAWNMATGWRWMFASETIPALFFFALLFFVPESPRWLTKKGREKEARDILSRVGGAARAEAELREIRQAIASESGSALEILQPGYRTALVIAVVLAILQQVTGINVIIYYAPKVFEAAGFQTSQAFSDTVIVGAVNVVFTLVAIAIVDRVGRKPILIAASAGMGVSLLLLGGAFRFKEAASDPLMAAVVNTIIAWPVLLFILAYVASFASAMGPVVWVLLAEIFPTRIRGFAMSIATVVLWIACYGVAKSLPWLLKHWGGSITFWSYSAMCAVAFVFIAAAVPETRGKSLEEIEGFWKRRARAAPRCSST